MRSRRRSRQGVSRCCGVVVWLVVCWCEGGLVAWLARRLLDEHDSGGAGLARRLGREGADWPGAFV